MLPMMITSAVQASVSVKRINEFMRSDELEPGLVKRSPLAPDTKDAVRISGASFRWEVAASSAAAKPETKNGDASSSSSKTNGAHAAAATSGEKPEEGGEETAKLLNGSAGGGAGESPREIFSLKDIDVR